MLSLNRHVGAKASALVDGALPEAEEERAWSHVLACPACRRLVEREGWVKRQLGSLSAAAVPPPQLLGSLYAVDAWTTVDGIEQQSRRRRTTALLVGGSAVGACVLGLITITGGPAGAPTVPNRQAPAMFSVDLVRAPIGSATGAETTPALSRRSR